MKLKLTKTATLEFDTAIERKRIAKAFKHDKETREKLYEIMDLVEKQEWSKALGLLQGKWWKGYDKKLECSRLEFVGMICHNSPFFENHISYIDIITNCLWHSEVYKVEKYED